MGTLRALCMSVVWALAELSAGCSSSKAEAPFCPGITQQPLYNGTAHESYLGLASPQIGAIVEIVSVGQSSLRLCSGTFIAPHWVVTARHCLSLPSPKVVMQGQAQSPSGALPIIASVGHPTADVALLEVDLSSSDAGTVDGGLGGVAPLLAGGASVAQLAAGEGVEIAGYGFTETGSVGSLNFRAESIVQIDPATVTVTGFGVGGACAGDSGGPLLIRGKDGSPVVAGVESHGSATCVDFDTYTRLDAVQNWIQATIGLDAMSDRECGAIGQEGRCLYGSALWCGGTELAAQGCEGKTRCGWDRTQAGFRCVDPSADPCGGVDSVGGCIDSAALRCRSGILERQSCGPCSRCRIDGRTGTPGCVPGAPAADGASP